MKKIIIISIIIFLFGDAASMHGMTTVQKGMRRLPTAGTAGKTLIQKSKQSTQPIQPSQPSPSSAEATKGKQSTKPISTTTSSSQPKIEYIKRKQLFSNLATAAKLKMSDVGNYVRNWFNNVMTSWFGAKVVSEPIAAPEAQEPLIVSEGSTTFSPFVTGIQKRQYSAVADGQASSEKISTAIEPENLIDKLYKGALGNDHAAIVKLFVEKGNFGEIERLAIYFLREGASLDDFINPSDALLIEKVENFKQEWFKQYGWSSDMSIAKVGDILLASGNLLVHLLPKNIDQFIDVVEKVMEAINKREVYRSGYYDVGKCVKLWKLQLGKGIVTKLMSEQDQENREKLFTLLSPDMLDDDSMSIVKQNPKGIKFIVSEFKKNISDKNFVFDQELEKRAKTVLHLVFISDPVLAEDLGLFIIHNLSQKPKEFIQSYGFGDIIFEIIKIFIQGDKELPSEIINFITSNYPKDKNVLLFLENVVKSVPENMQEKARKKIISLVEDLALLVFHNLSQKFTESPHQFTREDTESLLEIVKRFLMAGKKLPDGLIELVLKTPYGLSNLNYMVNQMPQDMQDNARITFNQLLVPILKQQKQVMVTSILDVKQLMELLSLDVPGFIDKVLCLDSSFANTPSYRHVQVYYEQLGALALPVNSHLINMIQHIMRKEKDLIDGGYEVFYHARRWQYGFLTDVYDRLYEYKSGKDLDDFMFTQLDDPVLGKVSEKFYAEETAKRERLLKEGNSFSHETKTHPAGFVNRQALLFLNKFLFGNLGRWGSCSMYYVLQNHNMGEIAFSVQEIFDMFGLNDAYQAFEEELQQLQKEHDTLSKFGEMLQIAIPKDNVDKCVYYTTSGGPKKEFVSTGVGQKAATTDIKTILADLDKNPQDIAEFVLVETKDKSGGLNPESGIKVFSYNTVDPAQWTAFKEKETALFDRIEEWMNQKKLAQVARE
jgi:hypothetical protein